MQAALKEIKKLIRSDRNDNDNDNDDDGNKRSKENSNLRKPELQFVGETPSNNENHEKRSCSKCEYFVLFLVSRILLKSHDNNVQSVIK